MVHLIYASAVSACFEMENEAPYYAPAAFEVYLNGEKQLVSDTNVFSLFSLRPDTAYTLTTRQGEKTEEISFHTPAEACAIDVRAFGATGDGKTDDTQAIQNAIHFTPAGARLYFPAGVYSTRPLALRSHLTLDFAEGAVLLGSKNREEYPILPGTVPLQNGGEMMTGAFEGLVKPMYQSLIHAEYCEDIALIGQGIVDGNAQNSDFWMEFKNFPTARPRLMFFCNCKNVTVHGLTGRNSPSWNMHPFYCEHVSFLDMKIQAPKDSPNTDAIDPEACVDVKIIGCRLSVGDDCIAIKSGKIELCRMRNQSARYHVIRNCLMEFGHGAVTLGSETACGVKDLTVNRCLFSHTDRGLRIKTRRGRGKDCDITGITFEKIRMDHVITPVVINMWYNCCDPDRYSDYVKCRTPLPVDERTPHLGEFTFRDLECTGAEAAACYIDGLPEAPIDRVNFENVRISFADDAKPFVPAMQNDAVPRCKMGLYLNNVKNIRLDCVTVQGALGKALIAENCGHVESHQFVEAE